MVIEIQCGYRENGERYGVKMKTKEKEKQLQWDLSQNMDTEGQDTKRWTMHKQQKVLRNSEKYTRVK